MHIQFLLILMVLLLGHYPIQALLPPLYHTLAEFKAVVEDKTLIEKLESGEAIISITRLEDGNFEVITTKHKIILDVVFEKTDLIGPGKFHLVVHDPELR
jgi:hypothetical protein